MRHEADCWIAACAMAVGASYEDAEGAFGSGADYSDEMLNKSDDPIQRRFRNWIRMLVQADFFTQDGCYPLFLPLENLLLQRERRYLLSGKSPDSLRPWMAHPIVLDESGQVFDPDPAFNLNDPLRTIQVIEYTRRKVARCIPKPLVGSSTLPGASTLFNLQLML